jgi:hypothetical protein
MATGTLPDQDVLLQLLDYDPETGVLTWKYRGPEWFNETQARTSEHTAKIWNQRYAETKALASINGNGYCSGSVLSIKTTAHRVIWKMETGEDADTIDHNNGNQTDNRWGNLRSVPVAVNMRNCKRRVDNTTGHVGIYWYPHERATGKWLAKIGSKHIGYFDSFDDAVAARKAAEITHNFHPNHGRAA